MRMCDRHRTIPAKFIMKIVQTDETFDLCQECEEQFRAFLEPPTEEAAAKRRGRPPKEDRTQVQ